MEIKSFEKFQRQLLKLEPVEFLGVARILGVDLMGEDKEPLPFEEVFAAIVTKYGQLSRRQRRNLDRILRPIDKKES